MTNGGESMKYKNPEDNLYDTKHYKNVATQPIDIKMVDKVVKEADSILTKYDYSKKALIIFGILSFIKLGFLVIFIPVLVFFCYLSFYKNVKVNYRLTEAQTISYNHAIIDLKKVSKSKAIYWIKSRSKVKESRYTAGASRVIERDACRIVSTPPFPFETNINILSVQSKNKSVSFFPDKIIIIQDGCISLASYEELKCEYNDISYALNGSVPSDAIILERTWQYANNDGSRDRRFRNNWQVPVCAFGELQITSGERLNLLLYFSNPAPFSKY